MSRLIDLHTHSQHSDGTLSPQALAQAAAARSVGWLALTDHDTTDGLPECAAACGALGLEFIAGVEITALWRGQEIHVVGLGIDPSATLIKARLAAIVALRRERIGAILKRLRQVPRLSTDESFGSGLDTLPIPTRTHVARELVARGTADSTKEAFDRWLARGRPGYVPPQWPAMESAIEAILSAGGHAVLAHPHRYRLSSGGRRALLDAFTAAGGAALELDLPGMPPSDVAQLADLARSRGLAGSAGSDFHEPGQPWRPLGRFAKLPEGIEPLWTRLAQTPVG